MKKLKTILCLSFTLIISCFTFIACTPSTPETETTITLSEAQSIIVDALKINDSSIQSFSFSNKNIDNRNIFTKFYNSNFSYSNDLENVTTSGIVQKNIFGNWSKYSLSSKNCVEYYDGLNAYSITNNEVYKKSDLSTSKFYPILMGLDCIYVDILFIDLAWENIYESFVTKTPTTTGYTFTMNINMEKYVNFVTSQATLNNVGTEGLFGEPNTEYYQKNQNEGTTKLVLSFDRNFSIIALDLEISSLCSEWRFVTTKINISKYTENFTVPNWLNVNDF